ncbi:MAG: SDR family oxidoreductase [Rhodospirillales bacterium]|nr:SDR family oxidoreductase [Rhodospirillales bacterium]
MEAGRGDHVGLVNDEDLVAVANRGERGAFTEIPGIVHTAVAGGIDLDHIQRTRTAAGKLDAVFDAIRNKWGRLDLVFHSIAWARKEDLHGRLTDCSADGFAESMLISCHSFIRMAKLAEPLMDKGGSLMTLSFYGAEKVVDHYNVMGPVKAALEASVRYLAHELGPKNIRVNAISAGAVATRAASGIAHFDDLLNETMRDAPLRRSIDSCEIGRTALLLASDYTTAVTGEILYADAGFHIEGMAFTECGGARRSP